VISKGYVTIDLTETFEYAFWNFRGVVFLAYSIMQFVTVLVNPVSSTRA
jgi:hypothetical protein